MNVAPAAVTPAEAAVPSLWRRMACFLYEGVLLFGVIFTVGLLFAVITRQTHSLQGSAGQVLVFLALALYFLWLWMHGGQTLAMKTWHIRLQGAGGTPLRLPQALARYLAAWVWFLPPLAVVRLTGVKAASLYAGVPLVWIALYALLAFMHPRRQFWHDALCGTELVTYRGVPAR